MSYIINTTFKKGKAYSTFSSKLIFKNHMHPLFREGIEGVFKRIIKIYFLDNEINLLMLKPPLYLTRLHEEPAYFKSLRVSALNSCL